LHFELESANLKDLRNEKNTDCPLFEMKKMETEVSPAIPSRIKKMNIKDTFKLIVTASIIVGIVISGIFLNSYLHENNLLIYATGTGHKAFFNSTWKMSPREIERTNNIMLSKGHKLSLAFALIETDAPNVADMDRYRVLFSKGDIGVWGHSANVQYLFFDNMLYAYELSLNVYDHKEHKKILSTLHKRFGEGKVGKERHHSIIYSSDWENEEQTVSYSFMEKDEESTTHHVDIIAVYKPLHKNIEKIARDEQASYF
jgi:hypothetical protein